MPLGVQGVLTGGDTSPDVVNVSKCPKGFSSYILTGFQSSPGAKAGLFFFFFFFFVSLGPCPWHMEVLRLGGLRIGAIAARLR